MARPVVILFAKAPRLGQVKQRLAAGIGPVAALRFYRNQLRRIGRELARLHGFDCVLAITPDRAKFRPALALPVIGQGHGNLGQRMARCFAKFRRRRAVLIGADIPGLQASDIRAAARILTSKAAVFGPALDGGYYLVGMGARRPAQPFANIKWSTCDALTDTLKNFSHHNCGFLRPLADVDTAADLRPNTSSSCALRRG